MTGQLVGLLGGARVAVVDDRGTVRPERALWSLEWWIGAEDRWHRAARETAVRQSLVDGMPVIRTAMRVPGGDAVHEVYGASGSAVVVDIENASPAPFVAALVVRGATVVTLSDGELVVDSVPAVRAQRAPSRWAFATDGSLAAIVERGDARDGAMPVVRDRRATVDVALLYPVAHRTRLRAAVALGRHDTTGIGTLDLTTVPSADAVARGWHAQLGRGLRVTLPDAALQSAVDTGRAQLLLAGQAWRADPAVYATLEDWGFDDEALVAWGRLGVLDRRRARRPRSQHKDAGASWAQARSLASDDGATRATALLDAVHRGLVHERAPDEVDMLPTWPVEWRGQPLDARDVPTRAGLVSFSVRWHGTRPALLWEAPAGTTVRAPGLDPSWVTHDAQGETLLGSAEASG